MFSSVSLWPYTLLHAVCCAEPRAEGPSGFTKWRILAARARFAHGTCTILRPSFLPSLVSFYTAARRFFTSSFTVMRGLCFASREAQSPWSTFESNSFRKTLFSLLYTSSFFLILFGGNDCKIYYTVTQHRAEVQDHGTHTAAGNAFR